MSGTKSRDSCWLFPGIITVKELLSRADQFHYSDEINTPEV